MAKPKGFSEGFGPGFGVGRYHYGLVPPIWDMTTIPGMAYWRSPDSAVGGVDLRPLIMQGTPGVPQGFFFAATLQPVDGVVIATALHLAEENATTAMQDAWQSAMGYRPQGAKLVDLLWDQLTAGSDPDGIDGPKPLMPGVNGIAGLHLGGHSLVKSARFHVLDDTPHADRVRTLLQRHFQQWAAIDFDHACRCLDMACERYGLNKQDRGQWERIVPPAMRRDARLLPHATTILESFNTANSTTLGPDQTWAEYEDANAADSWAVETNAAKVTLTAGVTNGVFARAESDLSSDDHYSQCAVTSIGSGANNVQIGPAARFSATTTTLYVARLLQLNDTFQLLKAVDSVLTSIGSGVSVTISVPHTVKTQADGSTIKSFIDTVEKHSVTDTAITGNTRCGIFGYSDAPTSNIGKCDDFKAEDLAAPPAGTGQFKYLPLLGVG